MRQLALPVHRHDGAYCVQALTTHDCWENHDYTQPVLVPTSHDEVYSAMNDHLFLNRVNQESAQQVVDFLNEAMKRFLQIGQYSSELDIQEGSSVIVAVGGPTDAERVALTARRPINWAELGSSAKDLWESRQLRSMRRLAGQS